MEKILFHHSVHNICLILLVLHHTANTDQPFRFMEEQKSTNKRKHLLCIAIIYNYQLSVLLIHNLHPDKFLSVYIKMLSFDGESDNFSNVNLILIHPNTSGMCRPREHLPRQGFHFLNACDENTPKIKADRLYFNIVITVASQSNNTA